MKYYRYVSPDRYSQVKEEYEEMGLSTDNIKPVDMNYGYVPMDVDYKSKNSSYDLEMTAKCNKKRFDM